MEAKEVKSSTIANTVDCGNSALMEATASSPFLAEREAMVTTLPLLARIRAVSKPMPLFAPVNVDYCNEYGSMSFETKCWESDL